MTRTASFQLHKSTSWRTASITTTNHYDISCAGNMTRLSHTHTHTRCIRVCAPQHMPHIHTHTRTHNELVKLFSKIPFQLATKSWGCSPCCLAAFMWDFTLPRLRTRVSSETQERNAKATAEQRRQEAPRVIQIWIKERKEGRKGERVLSESR